ncbi:MAG: CmcJ/NvfI family oxidoreductase [Halioglobus sp.]
MSSNLTATLRYLVPGIERPVYIASEAGADAALDVKAKFDDRQVAVMNARELDSPPHLDRQGFCLVPHVTTITDFYDLEPIRAAYEAEIIALVLAASGGESAVVFDHTLRSDSPEVRGQRTIREPAAIIHNDYTDASAVKRLQDILSADEAKERLAKRFAIINVWRSIRGPVITSPLALCDFSSTDSGDFVASERRAKERVGELELMTHNPGHRWYYYPEQRLDEALLIKTFDSARDGRARRAAHTAFNHPMAAPDAPPRESIESRLFVFF